MCDINREKKSQPALVTEPLSVQNLVKTLKREVRFRQEHSVTSDLKMAVAQCIKRLCLQSFVVTDCN